MDSEHGKGCGCEGSHGHGHGHGGKHKKPHFYGTATVSEKGQIVIPSEARKANDIKAGDKLIVAGGDDQHPLLLLKAEIMTEKIEHLTKKVEFLKSIQNQEEE